MADVKWIKLSLLMFDDEKIRIIEGMPEKDTILIIWIKLLTLAGKTNDSGYIYMSRDIPYTDEMLATLFNRPLNIVRIAIETFSKFGMISTEQNGYINITNWEKHQNIEGLEKIREQNRIRKQKERENKKLLEKGMSRDCHTNVTQQNKKEELELDKDIDIYVVEEEKSATTNVFEIYMQNISPTVKPLIVDEIKTYIDDIGEALIIKAIERAVAMNKPNWNYCKAILNSWITKGIKTVEQADNEQKIWQNKNQKTSNQNQNGQKSCKFNNFPQSRYNFNEIEQLEIQQAVENGKNAEEEIKRLLEERRARQEGAANA